MRTIDKIITKVNVSRGAPMGRSNVSPQNISIVDIGAPNKFLSDSITKQSKRIFDSAVPMSDGAYDKGGAYWGLGRQNNVLHQQKFQTRQRVQSFLNIVHLPWQKQRYTP